MCSRVVQELDLKCKGRGFDPRHSTYVIWQGINLYVPPHTQERNGDRIE